jgi:hypothetical protein
MAEKAAGGHGAVKQSLSCRQLNNYIFLFPPDERARQLVIEVVDRFGNTFSEKLKA